MRSAIPTAAVAAYFFALGWYVRASGLDEDLARIGRDAYGLAVLHTVKLVRESRSELDEAAAAAGEMLA